MKQKVLISIVIQKKKKEGLEKARAIDENKRKYIQIRIVFIL